jgi:hypothetical protein
MDNRVNKIRNKISELRMEMVATERAMRKDVAENLDCAAPATRLMALRAELARLVAERRTLGDLTACFGKSGTAISVIRGRGFQ